MRLLLVLAVLLAACAAWWALGSEGGTTTDAGAERGGSEDGGADADLEARGIEGVADGPSLTGAPPGARKRVPPAGVAGGADGADPAPAPAPAQAQRVRVEGVVRDAQGRPVAGAKVSAPSAPGRDLSVRTDAEGRFQIDLPPPGSFALVVRRDGMAEVTVEHAAGTDALEVTLTAAPTITGRVVDATSREPVAGVRVEARPVQSGTSSPAIASMLSVEDGSFSLPVPRAGAYDLEATTPEGFVRPGAPDGYVLARRPHVEAGGPAFEVELTAALAIEGQLLDEQGDRVLTPTRVDAVGLTGEGLLDYTRRRMTLVSDGVLRVSGLAPGRYRLTLQTGPGAAGAGGGQQSAATVVGPVEAGTRGLEVRMPRGVLLRGRLLDPEGAPVREARGLLFVVPEGQASRSELTYGTLGGDGTFQVGPLDTTRRVDLHLQGVPGFRALVEKGVDPRAGELTLRLTRGGRIEGRVVIDGGRPAPPGVCVGLLAQGADFSQPSARQFVYTRHDGSFTADGLLDLPHEVEAGGGTSGYLGTTAHAVQPGATNVVLRVVEGVELSGTLLDDRDQPVAAQSLQADDGMHIIAMRPYVQVGPDGRFRLRGLAPGKVRLGFQRGDRWAALGEFTAPATDLRVLVPPP